MIPFPLCRLATAHIDRHIQCDIDWQRKAKTILSPSVPLIKFSKSDPPSIKFQALAQVFSLFRGSL